MTSATYTREAGNLPDCIQELERVSKTKADYVVAERDLFATGDSGPQLTIPGPMGSLVLNGVTPHALNQVHDRLGIPREYGRKLAAEKATLWAENVNGWSQDSKKNVLTRCLDGNVRAVLSDKYRILDNYDLFFSAFKTLKEVGASITSVSIKDNGDRFYLRAVVPGWQEAVRAAESVPTSKPAYHHGTGGVDAAPGRGSSLFVERDEVGGDYVYPGVILQNSETGNGGLSVSPFIYRLICKNGLIADDVFRKIHLGEKQGLGYLSGEAREKESELVWLQVRDLIKATFDRDNFKELVRQFSETGDIALPNPIKAVDNVVANFGLSDDDKQAILNELVSPSYDIDPGRTVYGLINAVTNRAKAYDSDADKVTEFERIGGSILREPALVLARK